MKKTARPVRSFRCTRRQASTSFTRCVTQHLRALFADIVTRSAPPYDTRKRQRRNLTSTCSASTGSSALAILVRTTSAACALTRRTRMSPHEQRCTVFCSLELPRRSKSPISLQVVSRTDEVSLLPLRLVLKASSASSVSIRVGCAVTEAQLRHPLHGDARN